VAAAAVVWGPLRADRLRPVDEAPVARGAAARAERLFLYRFASGEDQRTPLRVGQSMRGGDELAFAYSNPAARR
jgi:hypothetical protein